MGTVSVLNGGLCTTVQDLGRPGHARIGVSAAGAADALAFRIANRLAGNPDNAPALEMTILGGTFLFETAAHVALAGADMKAVIESGEEGAREGVGVGAPMHSTFAMQAGQRLRFGATLAGVRAYLAVHGGFEVSRVLGSASTHAPSRLGGFEGRPLRLGDRLRFPNAPAPPPARSLDATRFPDADRQGSLVPSGHLAAAGTHAPVATLRVTDGAQAARFAPASRETLFGSEYTVTNDSDRMGLRLAGPQVYPPLGGQMTTEGMPLGAVQIPPGGEPVILFVDHQTTGGYPVIASVISADLPRVGQLRPRDQVRFEAVSLQAARELLLEQEAWLAAALPLAP